MENTEKLLQKIQVDVAKSIAKSQEKKAEYETEEARLKMEKARVELETAQIVKNVTEKHSMLHTESEAAAWQQ